MAFKKVGNNHVDIERVEGSLKSDLKVETYRNNLKANTVTGSGSNVLLRRMIQITIFLVITLSALIIRKHSDNSTIMIWNLFNEDENEAKVFESSLLLRRLSIINRKALTESALDTTTTNTSTNTEKSKFKEVEEEKNTGDILVPNSNDGSESSSSDEEEDTAVSPKDGQSISNKNDSNDGSLETQNKVELGEDESSDDNEKLAKSEHETDNSNIDSNTEVKDDKWGKWKFYDGAESTRPTEDYCAKYPNRDIPGEEFPENAWQTDAVYVNHFINEGLNLVERVQEAILEEYGHSKRDDMTPSELANRRKMFELTYTDVDSDICSKEPDNAGCTTESSFDGLVKRLLHALLTNDTFTVVMGGHSAAAGHGNHFKQSYTMQFFRIMEPVFNRLGMKLVTRNIANGGLGTMQNALGSKSLYGEEVDMIIWDSSMTEHEASYYDLFARQALLGNRAPVLYHGSWGVQKQLSQETGADIFFMGNGNSGLPTTMDEEQVLDLPWATRYLVCGKQRADLCNDHNANTKFRTKCWVDRPDFTPTTKQDAHVGSQVSWHPGFRTHQLTGRLMSFVVLDALADALSIWSDNTITQGHPLSDEHWHVTEYYESIKSKARQLDHTESNGCENLALPKRVCNIPLNGRSEFTPRANPHETSIRSILKPKADGTLPQYVNTKMLYEGPDVPNPALSIPDDAIDVYAIAGARRNLQASAFHRDIVEASYQDSSPVHHRLDESDEIVQGDWFFTDDIPPGTCGGEYHDICGRQEGDKCLLAGHMDHRGGIQGNCTSGWLVMELKDVAHGFVMIKIETWHGLKKRRRLEDQELDPLLCENFIFEYAINGKITTLNKAQFIHIKTHAQRVVELFPLLDDESMETQDLEVAIKISGCENEEHPKAVQFKLTHVYWGSVENEADGDFTISS